MSLNTHWKRNETDTKTACGLNLEMRRWRSLNWTSNPGAIWCLRCEAVRDAEERKGKAE